jgi:hypothetical protein
MVFGLGSFAVTTDGCAESGQIEHGHVPDDACAVVKLHE